MLVLCSFSHQRNEVEMLLLQQLEEEMNGRKRAETAATIWSQVGDEADIPHAPRGCKSTRRDPRGLKLKLLELNTASISFSASPCPTALDTRSSFNKSPCYSDESV